MISQRSPTSSLYLCSILTLKSPNAIFLAAFIVSTIGLTIECKNPRCVKGCPVSIDIPKFISHIKRREFESAAKEVAKYSALPAVCGRVCPQESQCEGVCVLGIKGEAVSIGKLERFIADYGTKYCYI